MDLRVAVGAGAVPARLYPAKDPAAVLVLAHGAGAGQSHPWMVRYARGLSARGLHVVTFDFPYMAAKKKVPDRKDALEACYRAVVAHVVAMDQAAGRPLFAGGKSMGGRIASQAAAAGELPVAGLVFFGYPLHPSGKPEQRRDAHLGDVRVPMLFVQGERDAFGTPAELRPVVANLGKRARLVVVEAGDHSLTVPKRCGRPQDEVDAFVWDEAARFVGESARS